VWTYTYADSHYTKNPIDPSADGHRLEGVPRHNASASLTYADPSGWQATAVLRYISKSYGDAHPADGLIQNARFLVDVAASYDITQNVQAFLSVQNLLGTRYIASNSGSAPILGTPRSVMSGVRLKVE
jgi:outer membrane receptor protein involved in Fe transport